MPTDHEQPEDPDRAAILRRRSRFIAFALSGLASASVGGCKPQPCLDVAPTRTTETEGEKTPKTGEPVKTEKTPEKTEKTPEKTEKTPEKTEKTEKTVKTANPQPCLSPPPDNRNRELMRHVEQQVRELADFTETWITNGSKPDDPLLTKNVVPIVAEMHLIRREGRLLEQRVNKLLKKWRARHPALQQIYALALERLIEIQLKEIAEAKQENDFVLARARQQDALELIDELEGWSEKRMEQVRALRKQATELLPPK